MSDSIDLGVVVCVATFQRKHGLKVDGVVGPQTARVIRGDAPPPPRPARRPARPARPGRRAFERRLRDALARELALAANPREETHG